MNKALFTLLLIISANAAFAQTESKDSIIKRIPYVNGKIIYTDIVDVKGHSAAQLDSAAKKWYLSYFIHTDSITNVAVLTGNDAVFNKGVFVFNCRPAYLTIPFYGMMTIQVTCRDNYYSYRISDIYFRPHNDFLNSVGYQRDPSYLMGLYRKKHLSFSEAWNISRHDIRNYLVGIDAAVRSCIASLNKAMNK